MILYNLISAIRRGQGVTLRIVHITQISTVNYMQYSVVQVNSVNVINDQI